MEVRDKLPSENDLATALNVSRITIRESLSRLAALGLLETRFGEGTFVCDPNVGIYMQDMLPFMYLNSASSRDSILEMLEFRLMYEVEATAFAAERITGKQLEELETLLQKMQMLLENEDEAKVDAYVEEDLNFHSCIAEATNNSLIIQLNSIMRDLIRSGIKTTHIMDKKKDVQLHHQEIFYALEKHDSERAKQAIYSHLSIPLKRYRKYCRAYKTNKL